MTRRMDPKCSQSWVEFVSDSVVSDSLWPQWTADREDALCMEFSRQEHRTGWPFPIPGYLPNPGIEPVSLSSPALAGGFFTTNTTWDALEWGGFSSYYYLKF